MGGASVQIPNWKFIKVTRRLTGNLLLYYIGGRAYWAWGLSGWEGGRKMEREWESTQFVLVSLWPVARLCGFPTTACTNLRATTTGTTRTATTTGAIHIH